MSTKIYDAYKFDSKMKLEDVLAWANELRPEVQELIYQSYKEKFIKTAIKQYDQMFLEYMGWRKPSSSWSSTAMGRSYNYYDDDTKYRKEHGYSEEKTEMIVMKHGRKLFVLMYAQEESKGFFDKYKGSVLTDYSYWGNTDRPDDVTSRQWRDRKKTWSEIFKNSWSPVEVGVSILLSQTQDQSRAQFRLSSEYRKSDTATNEQPLVCFLNKRAKKLHDSFSDAPWVPAFDKDSHSFGPIIQYQKGIEDDENKVFNEARAFLEQHVLDEHISLSTLFKNDKDLEEHFEQKRQHIYSLDIPSALATPSFEKMRMEYETNNNAPSAPKSKI